jgi:hypothetical protein
MKSGHLVDRTRRQLLTGGAALGAAAVLGKPAMAQTWSPT